VPSHNKDIISSLNVMGFLVLFHSFSHVLLMHTSSLFHSFSHVLLMHIPFPFILTCLAHAHIIPIIPFTSSFKPARSVSPLIRLRLYIAEFFFASSWCHEQCNQKHPSDATCQSLWAFLGCSLTWMLACEMNYHERLFTVFSQTFFIHSFVTAGIFDTLFSLFRLEFYNWKWIPLCGWIAVILFVTLSLILQYQRINSDCTKRAGPFHRDLQKKMV